MNADKNIRKNHVSLDPSNWDEFREIAHQMMDDMIDHMQTIRQRPV